MLCPFFCRSQQTKTKKQTPNRQKGHNTVGNSTLFKWHSDKHTLIKWHKSSKFVLKFKSLQLKFLILTLRFKFLNNWKVLGSTSELLEKLKKYYLFLIRVEVDGRARSVFEAYTFCQIQSVSKTTKQGKCYDFLLLNRKNPKISYF